MNDLNKTITAQITLSKKDYAELLALKNAVNADTDVISQYQGLESNILSQASANVEILVAHTKGELNISGKGKVQPHHQELLEFYNSKLVDANKKLKEDTDRLHATVAKHCQSGKHEFTGKFEMVEPSFLHILK
jgi:hypothetical protein